MSNFKIEFTVSPWLLLLLIPAYAVILFLYFKTSKKFRNTRNRITAIVLHSIVMTLCIFVLSGMIFTWTKPNLQSELVILVDASYTEDTAKERVDELVKKVLDVNEGKTNLSIVKFGYNQQTVLNMGLYSPSEAYKIYKQSDTVDVDDSATDIYAALSYCWDPIADHGNVIRNPQDARIFVLSDGLQTDRDAMNLARRIARDGVQIEVAFLPGTGQTDVWISDIQFPQKRYSIGEDFDFEIAVSSTTEGRLSITLTDVCEELEEGKQRDPITATYNLAFGPQTLKFKHAFANPGFHTLKFDISCESDLVEENNTFYTYYNVDLLSKILMIEKYEGESSVMKEQLDERAKNQYLNTTVMQIDEARVPKSAVSMLDYDEIFLVNISHSDMEKIDGFEEGLDSYVYDYGGSVFTVGGFERGESGEIIQELKMLPGKTEPQLVPKPHAYDEDDMKDTTYQRMLPVEITKYTPSIGLVFIIDRSSYMENDGGGGAPLDAAIQGAVATLDILSPRDYVGVMTLQTSTTLAQSMTPMTRKSEIVKAIRDIGEDSGGGTMYAPAIRAAQTMLSAFSSVDLKHIVLISNGTPSSTYNDYLGSINNLASANIMMTYFSINDGLPGGVEDACKATGGGAYSITKESISKDLPDIMVKAMRLDEYSGAVEQYYHPEIGTRVTAVLGTLVQDDLNTISMKGFFSSKEKGNGKIETILKATFLPLYSQWNYGRGRVGSFMCDAEDVWSKEFFDSSRVGIPIFNGIVDYVAPVNKLREQTLEVNFIEDNYRTQASVYGFEQKKEKDFKLIAFVTSPYVSGETPNVAKFDLSELSTGGNRFTFENREKGVHRVTIYKVPKSFDLSRKDIVMPSDVPEKDIAMQNISYRVFSFSEEYDSYVDPFTDGKELLCGITTRVLPEGSNPDDVFITDPEKLLAEFMDIGYQFDPRPWFIVISMVLLLIDIAVRKFRFKWLHEIISSRLKSKKSAEE